MCVSPISHTPNKHLLSEERPKAVPKWTAFGRSCDRTICAAHPQICHPLSMERPKVIRNGSLWDVSRSPKMLPPLEGTSKSDPRKDRSWTFLDRPKCYPLSRERPKVIRNGPLLDVSRSPKMLSPLEGTSKSGPIKDRSWTFLDHPKYYPLSRERPKAAP